MRNKTPRKPAESAPPVPPAPVRVDHRAIVVLQLVESATLSEIQAQQEVANEHARPFGLRVMVIPKEMNFVGCITPTHHREETV